MQDMKFPKSFFLKVVDGKVVDFKALDTEEELDDLEDEVTFGGARKLTHNGERVNLRPKEEDEEEDFNDYGGILIQPGDGPSNSKNSIAFEDEDNFGASAKIDDAFLERNKKFLQ